MASLRKTNRVLRTLSECSHTLIRAKDELELMKDICRIVVDLGGYRLAWVGVAEDNPERIVRPVAHWGYEDGYLEVLNLTWADTERGRGPTGSAIRNGAPSVFQNILTNPDYGFWREEALKRGYASAVAMPLKEEGRTFGALSVCAATLKEGLEKVKSGAVDVVFLDVRMPDGNGLEVLPEIQASSGEPEVIISTGYGDADGAELAIKSGAWDYIEKSSSAKAIHLSLTRALQYRKEKKTAIVANAVRVLRRVNIIGDSPQIHACLDMVAQAAVSDINVLITGETGTGKELFAQAIHNNSARAKSSFVVVDCAALPDTLVESLLFGHVKGSFTGADKDREGLIRQADGGTLFLDEVGELPLVLQKAFLRVLQEHRFRPVGSKSEVKSDFRLVATTNRSLETMVTEGTFRKDLLYRISAFALDLPPEIRIQVVRQTLRDPHQQMEASPTETHFKELPSLQDFRESIYTQAERQYLADLMDLTAGEIKAAIRISGLSQSRLHAIMKKHNIDRHS